MAQKIIGISGKRGSGKDLLGKYLAAYGYVRCPFAGALKERVRMEFGLTKEHTDGALKEAVLEQFEHQCNNPMFNTKWTPREIMIAYGQFFRQFDKNWWVNKMLADSAEFDKIVVTDLRFKNEAEELKKRGGFLVRLERKPSLNIYGPDALTDISETDLDSYEGFDLVVEAEYNVMPTDLEDAARRIAND